MAVPRECRRHPRVGLADLDEDFNLDIRQAVFEGTSGFDRDGVDMPVVVEIDGTWHMYYRAHRGRTTSRACHRPDGVSWTRQERVLRPGRGWDSQRIEPGSIEVLDNGQLRLWYSGTNGELWRIGTAISSDGVNFSREGGSASNDIFPPGVPGEWDDSGVRHPFALRGTDAEGRQGTHLWYAGSDGATWRGGYAFRPDRTLAFERADDLLTGLSRPVVLAGGGQFSPEGALASTVETDLGWRPSTPGVPVTDRIDELPESFQTHCRVWRCPRSVTG